MRIHHLTPQTTIPPSGIPSVRPVDRVQFSGRTGNTQNKVVIIGGGLAGVTAAYLAQKVGLDVLLLEAEKRLGGNAKMGEYTVPQTQQKMVFPMGASVLAVANDQQRAFFRELGIDTRDPKYKIHSDIVFLNGQWISTNPEEKQLDPCVRNDSPWAREFVAGVREFTGFMRNVLRPRDGKTHFPLREAPDEIFQWDRKSMKAVLDTWRGPEAVKQYFSNNLRSDMAADTRDISGLAGIIDQGADMGERILLPGGNYHLIERMLKKIKERNRSGDHPVEIITGISGLKVTEGKNSAMVAYRDAEGKTHKVSSPNVLLAIPSHRQAEVIDLPSRKAATLRSHKRGLYTILNVHLDRAPAQSNTYYKFPHARWIADAVQQNAEENPDLPARSPVPSTITGYVGIPSRLKPAIPVRKRQGKPIVNTQELGRRIIDEMSVTLPWLKKEIRDLRLTFYPEAMSAPAPGQMKQLRDFDPQLTPHVRSVHSDGSGVFAARGAIDEAEQGIKAVLEKQG